MYNYSPNIKVFDLFSLAKMPFGNNCSFEPHSSWIGAAVLKSLMLSAAFELGCKRKAIINLALFFFPLEFCLRSDGLYFKPALLIWGVSMQALRFWKLTIMACAHKIPILSYICYLFEKSDPKAQSLWVTDHTEHLESSHFHLLGHN